MKIKLNSVVKETIWEIGFVVIFLSLRSVRSSDVLEDVVSTTAPDDRIAGIFQEQ